MLRRCIAWYDDVLYVRAVYYLVGLCNVIYLLLMFSVSLSQNHGHIIWIPGKNKNLPPPPNTLFLYQLESCVSCPWVTVCTVPTSQCVYDWSWVTVCTVPTSQCVYELSLGYCVYRPHFPVCTAC